MKSFTGSIFVFFVLAWSTSLSFLQWICLTLWQAATKETQTEWLKIVTNLNRGTDVTKSTVEGQQTHRLPKIWSTQIMNRGKLWSRPFSPLILSCFFFLISGIKTGLFVLTEGICSHLKVLTAFITWPALRRHRDCSITGLIQCYKFILNTAWTVTKLITADTFKL